MVAQINVLSFYNEGDMSICKECEALPEYVEFIEAMENAEEKVSIAQKNFELACKRNNSSSESKE